MTKKHKIIAQETTKKTRLVPIDMMVGLAMILVILGHFTVGFQPEWYNYGLHNWIYSFHMEMFVFLSAFLIRYSYKELKSPLEYMQYIWRKFKKFFLWFLIIGFAVALLAVKVKGYQLTTGYILQTLKTLLIYPRWSEASFLWYIYILFGYYLISPLFFKLQQWARVLCCIGAMFLPMANTSNFLATYDFCQYTFFYCLGVLCAEWIEEIRNAKVWLWGLLSVPFIAYSAWLFSEGQFLGFEIKNLGWWTLVTGVSSIPFFYLLAMAIKKIGILNRALTLVSKDCYWIYLLQMFIIWGCTNLATNIGIATALPFWIFMTITTLLATAIPIALAEVCRKKQGSLFERPAKNTSLK